MTLPPTEIPELAQDGDAEGLDQERDRQVVEMVERDRLHVAGALHNSVCQSASGAQLLAATFLKRLPEEPGAMGESIREIATLLRQISSELRGVIQWLRPPPMQEQGLIVSLLELATEISSAIPCEFHCEDRRMEVDPYVAGQLYQIAHAVALSAVQRGAATRIDIELVAHHPNGLILSVSDDANPSDENGNGLEPDLCNWELLRLRSRAIGGKLTVVSANPGGVRVTCRVGIA